jgi:hypothetical protein
VQERPTRVREGHQAKPRTKSEQVEDSYKNTKRQPPEFGTSLGHRETLITHPYCNK